MGEKTLVEGALDDSIQLVRHFDAGGNKPTFATWYYYDDAGEWRLLLSSQTFDELLKKNGALAYQRVAEAITQENLGSLSISEIKIIPSSDPLPNTVKMIISTSENGVMRAHFSNTTINGIFIKEMFVLRAA